MFTYSVNNKIDVRRNILTYFKSFILYLVFLIEREREKMGMRVSV